MRYDLSQMMLVAFNSSLMGGEFGIGWGLATGFATIGMFQFLEYLAKRAVSK